MSIDPRPPRLPLVLALAIVAAGGLAIAGCASTPAADRSIATDGPPPDGFESWEEYWEAQDRAQRDLERDIATQRARQPQLPGNVR